MMPTKRTSAQPVINVNIVNGSNAPASTSVANDTTTPVPVEANPVPTPSNTSASEDHGHIYIVLEREFIKSREKVYKIGKTRNLHQLMANLPTGSRIMMTLACNDVDACEKELKAVFRIRFTPYYDDGYFYGNIRDMVCIAIAHASNRVPENVDPKDYNAVVAQFMDKKFPYRRGRFFNLARMHKQLRRYIKQRNIVTIGDRDGFENILTTSFGGIKEDNKIRFPNA